MYEKNEIFLEAEKKKKKHKMLIQKLKKWPSGKLDDQFQYFHNEAFEKINCLDCANCCKTTSPVFTQPDIGRISAGLKIRPVHFIDKYLQKDDEGDYVLKSSPCPFLESDNRCSIYHDRPTACRTYPHTNRKKIHQLLSLTYKNSFICPAVLFIFEKLEKSIKS